MRNGITLSVTLILVGACASPPALSDDFAAAADRAYAEGETSLTGWYWICNYYDQGYSCPTYKGPVETTQEAALAGKEDYVRRNPEYRDFVRIRRVQVDLPFENRRQKAPGSGGSPVESQ